MLSLFDYIGLPSVMFFGLRYNCLRQVCFHRVSYIHFHYHG